MHLDELQAKVLNQLTRGQVTATALGDVLGVPASTIASCLSTLETMQLVKLSRKESTWLELTSEGKQYAELGTPERRLVSALSSRELLLQEAPAAVKLSQQEFSIALQWAKRNGWVMMLSNPTGSLVKKIAETPVPYEALLTAANQTKVQVTLDLEKPAKELRDRRLAKILEVKELLAQITPAGKELLTKGVSVAKKVTSLTPQLVKTADLKQTIFQPYDVEANVAPLTTGKRHPLELLADQVRDSFIGMGFEEMNGPIVESSFWNFDVMFMPQNHPNRDMMDTFFLKQPNKAKVPEDVAKIVKEVHLNGWKTGSKGCASAWSLEEASKPILRTHTTATTYRYLQKIGSGEIKTPCKFFSINKVFRNEAIDRTHLPEFHQIEGFVVADNLNLRNLMGVFAEFYRGLGIEKIRFKPVFNPYTEPSMEIFGYHSALAKWVEIGNSGMFRPETLAPFGIKQNVIAWGLALERAAMILFEVDDIRKVVGSATDLQWIRDFPELPEVLR